MKALIAGYDLELKFQRGIGYFSRSLVTALYELGYEVHLLTSAKYDKNRTIYTLNVLKKLTGTLQESFKRKLLPFKVLEIILKQKWIGDFIPFNPNMYDFDFDINLTHFKFVKGFVNIPHFYDYTHINDYLPFNRSLKLTLPTDYSLFISISPMNVVAPYPTVQVIHDLIPLKSTFIPDNPKIFLKRLKTALEKSKLVLCVSEFSRRECLEVFPEYEEKLVTIYQPAPIYEEEKKLALNEDVQNSLLQILNLKKGSFLFYVGVLEKRKNIKRLIEAFLSVYNKIKIPLVLAGPLGFGSDEFKQYLENKKYKNKVIYLGYVGNIEKLVLMKTSRAFVFPSLKEGFGLPVLEAMALGTPVLTSSVSSLPEVCGSAALYVNPLKVSEIAEGLVEITTNETLNSKLSLAGMERAKMFSFKNFKEKLIKAIQSV
ncbi:glycosyltransferase involved in cell wall biosynthesis [Thermovibrio guaymasensis]|uniref:Glycosyltransferase involved in cell wall biosynthesis n=1 Tax=Thermovibrio guaymasensis TaxID=240167 RepID=A0A420W646_9BACT|nr:glycosyltransferase family 1 protein [Thermovibrio guaymasensis]RKQ60620.1 glycosyltransferase involved in cell wall biosynthesis [Thermovibrio guaymasensis]